MNRRLKENIAGYGFILPLILGILIFTAIPFVMSLYYSFTEFNGINEPVWNGFKNYTVLLSNATFWNSLKATAVYAVFSVVLSLFFSFLLGVFMNAKIPGIKVFRVLFYLPVVMPSVAAAAIWQDIFNPTYVGLANRLLKVLHIPAQSWFVSDKLALPTFIFMSLWGIGGGMLMWIAGFNGISKSYYEVAEIEGAGRMRKLVTITLPMMTPIIFYNLVMNIIASLQMFTQAYLIGTNESTKFIAIRVYETAFNSWAMGLACAMAWLLFVVIFLLTVLIFKTSKWVFYGDEGY